MAYKIKAKPVLCENKPLQVENNAIKSKEVYQNLKKIATSKRGFWFFNQNF